EDARGQSLGTQDDPRPVAVEAASAASLDAGILKTLLPLRPMMVAGYMAQQGGQSPAGGPGGMLGNVLGGLVGGGSSAPAAGGLAGGLGGLGKLIDMNGDGNPLDDILGMAGKLRG